MHMDNIYSFKKSQPRWASWENRSAGKGQGGKVNRGAKGSAYGRIRDGETFTLCEAEGSGVIRRIWITFEERGEHELKNIRLKFYWDGSDTPAVDVPIGGFFCMGAGKMTAFENEFFSSPEGRSFCCTVPMPFKRGAKLTLFNGTGHDIPRFFYDVDFTLEEHEGDIMYFHAQHSEMEKGTDGFDFEVLPKVQGRGRFLGVSLAVFIDERYMNTWFGEGEFKFYLDGDTDYPTLCGTGMEDYIGSAWSQGIYTNRYQGCQYIDDNTASDYRFHIPDPIFFEKDCRVTVMRMGGAKASVVRELIKKGVQLIPATVDEDARVLPLLETGQSIDGFGDDVFVAFYRKDGYSAVAYYYSENA